MRGSEEQDGRVHGMANRAVNARLDQLMAFVQLKRDRPILAQIDMRRPEEPKCGDHDGCAAPRSKPWELIVREPQPGRQKIYDR